MDICDDCGTEIDRAEDDFHADDAGMFCGDCYRDYLAAQEAIFAPRGYRSHVAFAAADAYALNDPKHPDFADNLFERAGV